MEAAARRMPTYPPIFQKSYSQCLDKRSFVWYIITMTAEQVREEQRKVVERVERWNESVRQVRELTRQWQRDNEAQFGPFLHPVEDEES
jgi:hypothetical protein